MVPVEFLSLFNRVFNGHGRLLIFLVFADLQDDKQFFIDHPGAVPITTHQILSSNAQSPHECQVLNEKKRV